VVPVAAVAAHRNRMVLQAAAVTLQILHQLVLNAIAGRFGGSEELQASQSLIVNVNTVPGAYPMRITFSYLNDKNEDQ
jgi:hypothetical protein